MQAGPVRGGGGGGGSKRSFHSIFLMVSGISGTSEQCRNRIVRQSCES